MKSKKATTGIKQSNIDSHFCPLQEFYMNGKLTILFSQTKYTGY